MRDNPPQRGCCSQCGRLSVRLLEPPLVRLQNDPDKAYREGSVTWLESDPFMVVEVHADHVICLVPDAVRGDLYCYQCWSGHTWPSIRPMLVNMPAEMRYDPRHPWAEPKWVSVGREIVLAPGKGS